MGRSSLGFSEGEREREVHMRKWWMDRVTAQSTVEYALVGALVVIAAATALTLLGEQVDAVFDNITATLQGVAKQP
jgi:Flp pilus assembly pilin Flp